MKTVQMDIVSYRDLLASLDPEEQAKLKEEESKPEWERYGCWTLRSAYQWEVTQLVETAMRCEQPQVVMLSFEKWGRQNVANFWVNDLAKPRSDAVNFHGQNISQWSYAGCILVEDGKVSTHH